MFVTSQRSYAYIYPTRTRHVPTFSSPHFSDMTNSPEGINFRRRIIKDIFGATVLPPLILSALAHLFRIRLGWLSSPAYLLSILLAAIVRVQYTQLVQRREAKQLGARLIPRVVGKWPGNIDVMLKMRKSFASSYIYNPYLELFEEHQCTTLNTRFLWMDNVSICPLTDVMFGKSTWCNTDNLHGRGTYKVCSGDRV